MTRIHHEARLHALRVTFDAELSEATFHDGSSGKRHTFRLASDPTAPATWLGQVLGYPLRLRCDDDGGFPDDTLAPGPTMVSTETLEAVASGFPASTSIRCAGGYGRTSKSTGSRRSGKILIAEVEKTLGFRIGEAEFEGMNPCRHCVVPSRDPETGEPLARFAERVAEKRAATLPPWAERTRFGHFYRLAVNTRAAGLQAGRAVRVGDSVVSAG